jgi:CHASE2 domain-containing sensor protein
LIHNRIIAPEPDSKIIIIDIDEKSLDVLKTEFGRWPWPRETLGGMLEWLEKQNTKAVVFDILFADVDQLNPTSDLAFTSSVEKSKNSFFPILRLNKINDEISEIHASDLVGFTEHIDQSNDDPKLAVIPPVFKAITDTKRLGFHNIYPDADGVNRSYLLWEKKEGWLLNSLPLRIAKEFGWETPETQKVLIRFGKEPYSYKSISFYKLWELSQSQKGLVQNEDLKNAIVIIGSTATNLFDVKSTPISSIHPGVHVLANIIDNLKNKQFIFEVSKSVKLLMMWVALLLMALASEYLPERMLKISIFAIPSLFLGVSYLSLNVGSVFIDLTLSASQALLFFSLISLYINWRSRFWANFSPTGDLSNQIHYTKLSFVMVLEKGNTNQQHVINQVSQKFKLSKIRQIGWLNELAKSQPAIYVATIYFDSKEDLVKKYNEVLSLTNIKYIKLYVSPTAKRLNLDVYPEIEKISSHERGNTKIHNDFLDPEIYTLLEALTNWSNEKN